MDLATTEAGEGSLADVDGPTAGGAKTNLVGINDLTVVAIGNSINGVDEVVETRDAVVGDSHVGTRSHVVLGVDDLAVAAHHDLIDAAEVAIVQSLGRIGPRNGGSQLVVGGRRHSEVSGSLGSRVVDFSGDEVEDSAIARVVVDLVEIIEIVAAAAPTPVVVEEAFVVITIAHESVATFRTLARIIERPSHIERFLQHLAPVVVSIVVSASQHSLVGVAKILGDSGRHILRIGTATVDGIVHVNSNTAVIHKQSYGFNLFLR